MSLDLSTVGFKTAPVPFAYDWKAAALYALGIGARREELDYLYEGRGPRVYPTFAVVPSMPPVFDCLSRVGGDPASIVHAAQSVRLVGGALRPKDELSTTATLRGIYDLKRFSKAVVDTETRRADGELAFTTSWSILYRGVGNFGGPRPPKEEPEPSRPSGRAPDFHFEQATSTEQALLYRLSGDLNPLHADPEFAKRVGFEQGPILHGLCTYGFVARAIIQGACDGDAARLHRLEGQFRKPVWPGDTIVVDGYRVGPDRICLDVAVKGRPEAVMLGTWAEITPLA